ncbi:MAG: glycosyltransferase family 2 protein [Sedimenticolaceae bacterium]
MTAGHDADTSFTPVSPASDKACTCAIVVTYHPDDGIAARLQQLAAQVDAMVVVDNTPGGVDAWTVPMPALEAIPVDIIENHTNLGIATALNFGLNHEFAIGCRWVLTMDQDTLCYPEMIQTLLLTAEACPSAPAVIGGNYFDTKKGHHEVSVNTSGPCLERKTVITSGCLVDAAFAREIGGFRDDFFIDQVDHEFCLRTRANGRRVAITVRPVMQHSVGGWHGPKVPFVGWELPDHSALRKYYITRNSIAIAMNYWRKEPAWCLVRLTRLALGLGSIIVFEPNKVAKTRAFARGLFDAIRRNMGPCPHTWEDR